jgi:SEC-C motif domain protein
MENCPCGSLFPYNDCCALLIQGGGYADTAEDLMRSRYSAFVKKKWDYLARTSLHSSKNAEDYQRSSENTKWQRLEVHGSEGGNHDDTKGQIEFSAWYSDGKSEKVLREHSHFEKKAGRWYYDEQGSHTISPSTKRAAPQKTVVRSDPKTGRNDPCPCQSGKKYKKCCGK